MTSDDVMQQLDALHARQAELDRARAQMVRELDDLRMRLTLVRRATPDEPWRERRIRQRIAELQTQLHDISIAKRDVMLGMRTAWRNLSLQALGSELVEAILARAEAMLPSSVINDLRDYATRWINAHMIEGFAVGADGADMGGK